jgi:hypothetical protein
MKLTREDLEVRIYHKPIEIHESVRGLKKLLRLYKKRNMFKEKTKKILLTVFTGYFLLMQSPLSVALALDIASPSTPSTPSSPTEPDSPDVPDSSEVATPEDPSLPENYEEEPVQEPDLEPTPTESPQIAETITGSTTEESQTPETTPTPTPVVTDTTSTGSTDTDNQVGDTEIDTGDATTTAGITTVGNINVSSAGVVPTLEDDDGGVTISNDGNGTDSENSGSVSLTESDDTVQLNEATVVNNLYQETETGDNSASRNVGDSIIKTGDANTTGTVMTAVNTNIDGVMVNEFNIADDHMGDYILDFESGCISGCYAEDTSLTNSGNGSDSVNDTSLDSLVESNTFQNNDAAIENNITLKSDSGNNDADRNTGGDSIIETGDANVSANVLTYANNNLSGNVIYSVVNIFGDLIGDIIFPEGYCCFGDITATNSDNGSDTLNVADIDLSNNDQTFQANDADIKNNLVFDANTGDNDVSKNTGGTNSIKTGSATVDAQVVNIANTNISGGDWWLVIVNEAGNWVGKIYGATIGDLFGGSDGFAFSQGESGEINVTNSDNGSQSENTASVSQTNQNTTVQSNEADITNNINLSANTGGNSASRNTGGDSSITTGDANIIANLVNFVNNNISGGRLFVNVVNVFGSWMGDFMGPGQKKESNVTADSTTNGVGGSSQSSSNTSSSSESQETNVSASEEGDNELVITVNNPLALVASAFVSSESFSGSGQENSQEEVDAGQEEVLGATAERKTVRVNLAYVLLALPFLAYIGIRKIRKNYSKSPAQTKGQ